MHRNRNLKLFQRTNAIISLILSDKYCPMVIYSLMCPLFEDKDDNIETMESIHLYLPTNNQLIKVRNIKYNK
jgi:hypothetical protein